MWLPQIVHCLKYHKQSRTGSTAAQRCSSSFPCNGTLCGLGDHWRWFSQNCCMKMKVISQRESAVIQLSTAVGCTADQTDWPWGHYIRFHLSWGPSFISDIYSWMGAPLSKASWLPVCTEAPSATLEKPSASDLHCLAPLVCSVWPVPLEEENEPITSRCSETNMMSSSRFPITDCRWEGFGLSAALFT